MVISASNPMLPHMKTDPLISCPLCHGKQNHLFFTSKPEQGARLYYRCQTCDLTHLPPSQRPSAAEEKAEYDLHENNSDDPRYRAHLAKLTTPLLADMPKGSCGLDFGCGPGPAISPMLQQDGMVMHNYDPFYAADNETLGRTYDFITCTEVAEHFHHPAKSFALIKKLLKPKGRLGVMTQFLLDDIDFNGWWYRQEMSHVAFYSPRTMEFIANRYDWRLKMTLPNLAFFYEKS